LKYDMYRNAWPLLALATYRKIVERAQNRRAEEVNGHPHPRMVAAPNQIVSQS